MLSILKAFILFSTLLLVSNSQSTSSGIDSLSNTQSNSSDTDPLSNIENCIDNKCTPNLSKQEQNSCVKQCFIDNNLLSIYDALNSCINSCTGTSLSCLNECTDKLTNDIDSGKLNVDGNTTTSNDTNTTSNTATKLSSVSILKSKYLLYAISLFIMINITL
ncbi:hypothetical protein BB558_005135 [Smittium angustum]|uniref:Transmembrane protein n=1 Tax=Smittium angustum TaxID=133377 RepID=A0A2U1J1C3_SMIAN|nr:hypothetical protein BB558_005135 [Smittium angustum]